MLGLSSTPSFFNCVFSIWHMGMTNDNDKRLDVFLVKFCNIVIQGDKVFLGILSSIIVRNVVIFKKAHQTWALKSHIHILFLHLTEQSPVFTLLALEYLCCNYCGQLHANWVKKIQFSFWTSDWAAYICNQTCQTSGAVERPTCAFGLQLASSLCVTIYSLFEQRLWERFQMVLTSLGLKSHRLKCVCLKLG